MRRLSPGIRAHAFLTSVPKILPLLVLLLLAIGFAASAVAAIVAEQERTQASGPALSVSEVVRAMVAHPSGWAGRPINVRGVVAGVVCSVGCTARGTRACLGLDCRSFDTVSGALREGDFFYLQDEVVAAGQRDVLFIRPSYREAWLDRMGSIPLLGSLIIPGRSVRWLEPAVYSLRVQWGSCGRGGVCPMGVLEDVARE